MVEAGLLVAGDDIPVPYDRFRDRVMFPIADLRGRVIAFGGRALEKDAPAKYLNSPETPLFHKGGNALQHRRPRAPPRIRAREVIAVEGYVDVIAMVSAGFEATVAPLGTALTAEQLALLWRMADEPMLCFDGDGAGRRAAYRAVDLALPLLKPGKSLRFASLPEGQDPDDLVRAGRPRGGRRRCSARARPLAEVLWMRETEAGGFDTPERRAALEARIGEVTAAIGDETVRKYYRRDFGDAAAAAVRAAMRGGSAAAARRTAVRVANRRGSRQRAPEPAAGRNSGPDRRSRLAPLRSSGEPYVVASPQLAASPVHRGHRAAIPRREALILQAVDQPSLAAARSPGGAGRHRVPPRRDRRRSRPR